MKKNHHLKYKNHSIRTKKILFKNKLAKKIVLISYKMKRIMKTKKSKTNNTNYGVLMNFIIHFQTSQQIQTKPTLKNIKRFQSSFTKF